MTFGLATPNSSPIASLCVYRDCDAPLLVDVDVLAEELGGALSFALARFLEPAPGAVETIRAFEKPSLRQVDKRCETVSPAIASD